VNQKRTIFSNYTTGCQCFCQTFWVYWHNVLIRWLMFSTLAIFFYAILFLKPLLFVAFVKFWGCSHCFVVHMSTNVENNYIIKQQSAGPVSKNCWDFADSATTQQGRHTWRLIGQTTMPSCERHITEQTINQETGARQFGPRIDITIVIVRRTKPLFLTIFVFGVIFFSAYMFHITNTSFCRRAKGRHYKHAYYVWHAV